jgi:Fe-S-cluster containining protein
MESVKDPKKIALLLLKATALTDGQVFRELDAPKYTSVDYVRMACHILFNCQRCGTCCTTGDPIRLLPEDAALLAKHLKIPFSKALKKYTIPDPDRPGVLDFKHILPCKFFDAGAKGCKIYALRPWSCRIFPFLGVYGSENQIKVNESCPGSVETMKILTEAVEEARKGQKDFAIDSATIDSDVVREAKKRLRSALDSI